MYQVLHVIAKKFTFLVVVAIYMNVNGNNNYCQHTLQAIWTFGLMEKLVCIWMIWQIRRMGLI